MEQNPNWLIKFRRNWVWWVAFRISPMDRAKLISILSADYGAAAGFWRILFEFFLWSAESLQINANIFVDLWINQNVFFSPFFAAISREDNDDSTQHNNHHLPHHHHHHHGHGHNRGGKVPFNGYTSEEYLDRLEPNGNIPADKQTYHKRECI